MLCGNYSLPQIDRAIEATNCLTSLLVRASLTAFGYKLLLRSTPLARINPCLMMPGVAEVQRIAIYDDVLLKRQSVCADKDLDNLASVVRRMDT
tara:strand:- start:1356 stop:1637 length:282 start_codon:yes stop_codon:yes gene_type:complete